jgi:hypothetical protein
LLAGRDHSGYTGWGLSRRTELLFGDRQEVISPLSPKGERGENLLPSPLYSGERGLGVRAGPLTPETGARGD